MLKAARRAMEGGMDADVVDGDGDMVVVFV